LLLELVPAVRFWRKAVNVANSETVMSNFTVTITSILTVEFPDGARRCRRAGICKNPCNNITTQRKYLIVHGM
jgi:hypothetical protein